MSDNTFVSALSHRTNVHVSKSTPRGALAVALAILCCLSGCFHTVIDSPAKREGSVREDAGVTWFALSTTTTNAADCKHGIAKAEAYMPVWGLLVYYVTVGIAAPMRTVYTCAAAPSQEGRVSEVQP